MLDTVKVPKDFEPIFKKAQEYASNYFKEKKEEPSKGTIEIFGERYILIRAASMSVDFFDTVKNLYKEEGEEEALNVARNLLFDIAHAIGKADARNFHIKMNLKDPIEKLSAGPVHFAHTGWAFVEIFPESRPTPDEDFYLIYDHPFSFEADAWNKAGKRSDCPVCVMNAGYSTGWCEESFGIPLVTAEILCKAKGDEVCRFIMAHPSKIEGYIRAYVNKEPELATKIKKYEIPGFFKRKQIEDERKRAEEILRATEKDWRDSFNSLEDIMLLIDADFRIIRINDAGLKYAGKPVEEVVLQKCYKIFHGRDQPIENCPLKKSMKTKKVESIEQFEKDFGRYLSIKCSPIFDEHGEIIKFTDLISDITERKAAEVALRESDEKIRSITASAQDAIIMIDNDRNISYWNEAAERTFGYTEEEIIGKELHTTLAPGSFYEDFLKGFETFRETGEGAAVGETLELVAVRKGGTEFPIALSLSALKLKGKWNAIGVIRDITEQKRAEAALREGEQLLRATIESTGDGILVVNEKGQVTHSNAQFAQMWRIPEEVMKTRDDNKLLNCILDQLKDPQAFLYKVQELYKSSNESIDTTYFKDGRIFERFSSPLITEGEIAGRVWCFKDATERSKIREGLQESEEKYRLLADNTLDCVWQTGLDFKFTYVNPSVLQMFGFTQEEWIGTSLSDHCPPEDMDFMSRLAKEGLKKGPEASGVTFETRILHKNGETIDVEIVANVMLDEDKNPVGFQGTTRDITERKRMEKDLENSKQHFQMLFNHMVDPVVIIDSEGVFLAVTDRVEEITGLKREELLGRNFLQLEIVTDESKALMAENLAKRTKGQDIAPYEVEVLLKDRRKMPYEVNAALITYMGKIADMVIFRDISDRKHAEEELGKRTEDLERFNKLAVDRELVMIELKKEVNRLYERQGEKPHYDLSFLDEMVLKK